jgi:hypothetical protein
MPHSRFRPVMPLMAATIVLPLAFGQNPSRSGNGDVFSSRTNNNNDCQEVYKRTGQKINEENLRMQAQSRQDQANCGTNQSCVQDVQQRRIAAERAAREKLTEAQAQLDACEGKAGGTGAGSGSSGVGGARGPRNTGGTVLKGHVEENVKPDPAGYKGGAYNEDYGKVLPSMTGEVSYKGTTLKVTTAAGRIVGQGMAGPVDFVSSPKTYSRAEGIISSTGVFTITGLWNLKSQPVLKPGETISVPIHH